MPKSYHYLQPFVFKSEHKLTAGHDVSDGGLITCVLEMAFAGNCGLTINVPSGMQAAGDAKGEGNSEKYPELTWILYACCLSFWLC